jgi:CheY-like chemotaxis protein/two-component sensor histidine kinase
MALADDDRPRRAEARTLMERQMEQMVRLVDDLLDVSRMTRGRVELRKERVELGRVIQSALEISRPLIEASGHDLVVRVPSTPIPVDGDATRLARVFANLLNNAAKYTQPGGRIWLTAEPQGREVAVRVRDTGIGIAPDAVPRVFDMFTQVASSDRGGLGIGLALVRRLVALHDGSVACSSEGPGRGSEFVVRLPVLAEPSPLDDARPAAAPSAGPGRRILVVDDNRDSADSLAMMLELLGHATQAAYDGRDAVETFGTFEPEVVLLDIGMPRLTGLEAAREIRRRPRGPEVVLIAMTGWGQGEDRRKAREAGFDHYLIKPVHPEELQSLLARLARQPA